MERIESAKNPRVKELRALWSKKGREEQGAFLLEGPKLLKEALSSGFAVRFVLCTEEFSAARPALIAAARESGAAVYFAARAAIEAASEARTPQEVVAAAALPALPQELPEGLAVALDAVQDPGNVGAILRCADAMGACGVLLGPGCADPYAPKAMRASMGSALHLPLLACASLPAALRALKARGFRLIAAHLRGEERLPAPLGNKLALLIGNEGKGLSAEVTAEADWLFRLKMKGRAESLNAAVCAGILLYELSAHMEAEQ